MTKLDEQDAVSSQIADAMLEKVKHFTVGFALAGETPAAKGSGVLVRYGEVRGILTCAHVDTYLRALKRPVGLVRLNRRLAEQFGVLDMGDVFSFAAGEEPWTPEGEDLCFVHLPPHLVGNIEKDCVFLNLDRVFEAAPPDEPSVIQIHAVFGLVEEFTGSTTRQGGRATTRLRGVLTPGTLQKLDPLTAVIEAFAHNMPDLPASFGGTSGGGLWRIYLRKDSEGAYQVVDYRLLGIASYEDVTSLPRLTCQGPKRIQALLEEVRAATRA